MERYHATSVQSCRSRRAGCWLLRPQSSASTALLPPPALGERRHRGLARRRASACGLRGARRRVSVFLAALPALSQPSRYGLATARLRSARRSERRSDPNASRACCNPVRRVSVFLAALPALSQRACNMAATNLATSGRPASSKAKFGAITATPYNLLSGLQLFR